MTCIVGLIHKDCIYMGADSMGTAGHKGVTRKDEKIFECKNILMGGTGSFRMIQLLRYKMTVPKHHTDVDTFEYMVTDFVDAVRKCLKDHGFMHVKDLVESFDGKILIGYKNQLFTLQSDLQVGENVDQFNAIGSGEIHALSSLFTTDDLSINPERRITLALEAAEYFNTSVRRPFIIKKLIDLQSS